MAPLRVLCIHGYRQNSSSFREKTGALRKLLKKSVELVFVDAPLTVQSADSDKSPQASSGPVVEADGRGWWFSDVAALSFSAQQQCEVSLGLDQSVTAVRDAIRTQGPFDGILGFSQGAAFVTMLCSLQEQNLEPDFNFRFAVLVAGFRSACSEHERFYKSTLQIPSLHVFGQEDRVIPDHMSKDLLPVFNDPQILTHPGGHFVPAASAHRQSYQDFLKTFQ